MKNVLFSLHDTSQAVKFASDFVSLGWNIIATQETHALLHREGIKSKPIEEYTGFNLKMEFPPTLHPKIENALAGPLRNDSINMVYVNPYPLTCGNDVGGHTLLALAIKGERIPVFNADDMIRLISELRTHGEISKSLKLNLINKAIIKIINHYLKLLDVSGGGSGFVGKKVAELLCGENPYQTPCYLYSTDDEDNPLAINNFSFVAGDKPCYTNIADLHHCVNMLTKACESFQVNFGKTPFIVIAAKHGNPCGFAADWHDPAIAVKNALYGNPQAIWGGEMVTNFPINDLLATIIFKDPARKEKFGSAFWMLDIIAAPDFSEKAVKILGERKERKLVRNAALYHPRLIAKDFEFRYLNGGFLRQPIAGYVFSLKDTEIVSLKGNYPRDLGSLILAWASSWGSSLGGNEVALAKEMRLIGIGGGPSTVTAAKHAVEAAKANSHSTQDSVFAADAFFPFLDAPEILVNAGCAEGIAPMGGNQWSSVISYFESSGVTLYQLPKLLRGFCRH